MKTLNRYALGKGEVVSSILTGSTSQAADIAAFHAKGAKAPMGRFRQNEARIGASIRGKPVESVLGVFTPHSDDRLAASLAGVVLIVSLALWVLG